MTLRVILITREPATYGRWLSCPDPARSQVSRCIELSGSHDKHPGVDPLIWARNGRGLCGSAWLLASHDCPHRAEDGSARSGQAPAWAMVFDRKGTPRALSGPSPI